MKSIIRVLQVIIFSWVLLSPTSAQILIKGKTIEEDSELRGDDDCNVFGGNCQYIPDYLLKARDKIILKPGFSISALAGNEMEAIIDESLVFDVDYLTGNEIPDVNTREINKNLPVGTTNGVFNVSATGAATYTIPIFTSPGTAGMQPKVSINYNSQSGNGLLGMGWQIGGLSIISRVPQIIYHDGNKKGIELNGNDRFALDGNRLITTGTYGGNGTTYKTEAHNFATITSIDANSDNNPEKFTVVAQNGTTIEYGGNAQHQVNNGTSTKTIAWCINRVTDANGNYIQYYYARNATTGEFRVTKIAYTGNETAGLNPYNEIVFLYETRTADKQTSYVSGYKVKQNVILRGIKVMAEGALARKYMFKYSNEFYTHLNEIIEYDGSGNRYNSTIVNWGEDKSPHTVSETILTSDESSNYIPIDINGDGKSDLIRFPNVAPNRFYIYNSNNESGPFSFHQEVICLRPAMTTPKRQYVGDFNGDGHQDLLVERWAYNNDNEVHGIRYDCYKNNGRGALQATNMAKISVDETYNPDEHSRYLSSAGDFNGDGISDILFSVFATSNINKEGKTYESHLTRIYLGSTSGTFTSVGNFYLQASEYKENYIRGCQELRVRDFNGDGLTDVMLLMPNGYRIYTNSGGDNGNNYFSFDNSVFGTDFASGNYNVSPVIPGDFNGDGQIDILAYTADNNWRISQYNGKRFLSPYSCPVSFTTPSSYNVCKVADYNGDGKADIWESAGISGGGVNAKVHYSINGVNFHTDNVSGIFSSESGAMHSYSAKGLVDFNGDGKADLFHKQHPATSEPAHVINFHKNETKHLVTDIANGLSQKTHIEYQPLTSSIVYTKGESASYPIVDIQGALQAVYNVQTSNGIGGNQTTFYEYEGARSHKLGKGFLGFSKTTVRNNTTNQKVETINQINLSNFLLEKQTINTYHSGSSPLSTTVNDYNYYNKNNRSYFNYLEKSTVTNHLTNVITVTDNTYNSVYGYLTEQTSSSEGISKKTGYSLYLKGKPGLITVTQKHPDDNASFTDKTRYYYDGNGNLTQQIDHFNKDQIHTNYSNFNSFGMPREKTISATGEATITSSWTYDSKKRFITSTTNAIGTETFTYSSQTGNILTSTDMNGNKVSSTYDGFGRIKSVKYPTGAISNSSLQWANNEGPQGNALFYSYSTHTEKPWVKTYYDGLGREVLNQSVDISNSPISGTQEYYLNGKLKKTGSNIDGNVQYTTYTYKPDGRLETEIPSNGASANIRYDYQGKKVTTTINRPGKPSQVFTKTYDAGGNLSKAGDAGGIINYDYYAHGVLQNTTTNGNSVTMAYVALGRQRELNDPDAGVMSYTYNRYGQLKTQNDAKGNSFINHYDNLGRIDYIEDTQEGITDYEYHASGLGKGLLKWIEAPNGIKKEYTYNKYGSMLTETEFIETGIEFATTCTYNSLNKLSSVTYPSGITITYKYNSELGHLEELLHNSHSIWKLGDVTPTSTTTTLNNSSLTATNTFTQDGRLESTRTTHGGSNLQNFTYGFNQATGNLDNRQNLLHTGTSETFSYDNLNRLTGVTGPLNQQVTYDGQTGRTMGNIATKTGAGIYSYEAPQPHAVSGILESTEISDIEQNIDYTTFNKISSIEEGTHKMDFTYGPNQQRKKSVYYLNGTEQWTRYYNGAYELTEYANGDTKKVTYISVGDGLTAVNIEFNNNGGDWYYVLKDHLGSIVGLVDENGLVAEEYSYDAWGRRRNASNWTYANVSAPTLIDRGYTGHEHMDMFNLINMNGRVYDPITGQMLSPDNYVQAAGYTQNYNRYAYCYNNPLKYTDPSGEWISAVLGGFIGGALNLYNNRDNYDNIWSWEACAYFNVGGLAGSTGGYFSNIGGAILAGAILGTGNALLNGDSWDVAIGKGVQGAVIGGFTYKAGQALFGGLNKTGDIPMPSESVYPLNDGSGNVVQSWDVTLRHRLNNLTNGQASNIGNHFTNHASEYSMIPVLYASTSGGLATNSGGNIYPNGMTITEAVDHARYGGGEEVSMPLSAVDLSKVKVSDFNGRSTMTVNLGGKYKTNWNDHIVHGSISLQLVKDNIVRINPNSKTQFNFEVGAKNGHPWFGPNGQFGRNVATMALEWYVNNGQLFGYKPYNINYTGTATISY